MPMGKKNILLITAFFYSFATEAQRYGIVIDEVMADPSPQIGLPNHEWVELKNTTTLSINLSGWKISDAGSSSGPMPNFILKPDSFVIVCATSAIAAMTGFAAAIAVTSFPSLDNNGDQVSLKDNEGKTIHAVAYTIDWYHNELKKDGGWTLEMIDTNNPCAAGNNWKASIGSLGGTPGKKNSVNAINNDEFSPRLQRAWAIDNVTIILLFNEPIDSLKGAINSNYSLDGGLTISAASTIGPVFDKVQLKLATPMQPNTVYVVTAANVADCKNNIISSFNNVKVGLPADALPGDMIINEILFNPRPNSYDYVEFYNNSDKILDASHLYVANRNSNHAINSITLLTTIPWLVFPGEYVVITEDASSLSGEYLVKNPEWVLSLSSLPSFPDEDGFVLLLNFQGEILDEIDYRDDWHFKLIADAEGVALERVDPNKTSQDGGNWHSAGSTAGYGTPTYKNSQYKQPPGIDASIEVKPKILSPDNDGLDDIATIEYKVDAPGYVANITIFDAAGRPIRNLVRNGILASAGYWNWDGLDDRGRKLPVGPYIIFTELFNLQGKKARFKNTVVLARKY
ncbi:MAG TPA: lamin tail domain-containing protein [Chitinophagaceae bacterium]|nr:lamin tail domain-containing protein [Chitinophagaceae bacterium]